MGLFLDMHFHHGEILGERSILDKSSESQKVQTERVSKNPGTIGYIQKSANQRLDLKDFHSDRWL